MKIFLYIFFTFSSRFVIKHLCNEDFHLAFVKYKGRDYMRIIDSDYLGRDGVNDEFSIVKRKGLRIKQSGMFVCDYGSRHRLSVCGKGEGNQNVRLVKKGNGLKVVFGKKCLTISELDKNPRGNYLSLEMCDNSDNKQLFSLFKVINMNDTEGVDSSSSSSSSDDTISAGQSSEQDSKGQITDIIKEINETEILDPQISKDSEQPTITMKDPLRQGRNDHLKKKTKDDFATLARNEKDKKHSKIKSPVIQQKNDTPRKIKGEIYYHTPRNKDNKQSTSSRKKLPYQETSKEYSKKKKREDDSSVSGKKNVWRSKE